MQIQELLGTFDTSKWFSMTFVKRGKKPKKGETTGEGAGDLRTIRCITGVKKHLKGGSLGYDAKEKGLVIVWIIEPDRRPGGKDNGYRAIPVEGIIGLVAEGTRYGIVNGLVEEL